MNRDVNLTVVLAPASEESRASVAGTKHAEQVIRAHYDFVWRLLRRLGVAAAAADDAAQQVFTVYSRKFSKVPFGKEKTFLFGVALRVAQSTRRKSFASAKIVAEPAIDALPAAGSSPEEQLDAHRARVALDHLLEAMPFELRTVFVLYELEDMTMAEIATCLALPNGTVASRLRRARELFQQLAQTLRANMSATEGR